MRAHPEQQAEGGVGKTGWLWKKTRLTRRWKPAWCRIQESGLLYGAQEQSAVKRISLIGARLETVEDAGRSGWTITPKNSKRTFHLRAGSSGERQDWMVAICEAQMKSGVHSSNACFLQ